MMKMKTLCLIPARGASKGIPRKNIRLIAGKPLIAHAIECALNCHSLDEVMVSTDCEEIASVARQAGANVPFLRPAELARDDTPMLPVLQHAVRHFEEREQTRLNQLVLLDPTAPLRTIDDVEGAIDKFKRSDCDLLVSGSDPHRNPYFNMVRRKGDFVELVNALPDAVGSRQTAPEVFDLNTVVWIYSRHALLEEPSRMPPRTMLYLVPRERAVDLDTEFDLMLLEFILDGRKKKTR